MLTNEDWTEEELENALAIMANEGCTGEAEFFKDLMKEHAKLQENHRELKHHYNQNILRDKEMRDDVSKTMNEALKIIGDLRRGMLYHDFLSKMTTVVDPKPPILYLGLFREDGIECDPEDYQRLRVNGRETFDPAVDGHLNNKVRIEWPEMKNDWGKLAQIRFFSKGDKEHHLLETDLGNPRYFSKGDKLVIEKDGFQSDGYKLWEVKENE